MKVPGINDNTRRDIPNVKFIIEHLSKRYETNTVLRDIDFTFESGKIYGLLGRNGAGKTTLFNCLNRDIHTDSGNFYIEENSLRRDVRPEDIGYVLSTPTVPEFLTGREFLKFFLDINETAIQNRQPIDTYFTYMHIDKADRDKLLKDYSHGMKNKMQMLANFILQPSILLLDEPLTSLDVVVTEEMKEILTATYLICFYMMRLRMPTLVFGCMTIVFCILYCIAACVLVYRLAPKTFRLRL